MKLAPGNRLGPYEIIAPIGKGGMGEVYRARDTRLDRDVAIKVLPERTARDENALARFRRETKALAALSHPNIMMILDVGEDGGVNYAVMELLEGATLRQCIQDSRPNRQRSIQMAAFIADGLAAAHSRNVVHRDLKPENLFLTRDGTVKILDFGLARTESPAEPHAVTQTAATQPGVVLGTANYMSPEQVRGQPADARSDIFSLGCVLYELLAGQPPFLRSTTAETMTAILREHPPGVSSTGAHASSDTDPIVARCLEKDPDDRFQSARDLAFSLREALARERGYAASRGASRRSAWALVTVVAVMFGLFAGIWTISRSGQATDRARSGGSAAASIDGGDLLSTAADLPTGNESSTMPRLAVLPFEDLSAEPEVWFADGMTEAVNFDLAQIGGLWVAAHPSMRKYGHVEEPIRAVQREFGVSYVVLGSVSRGGDRIQIRVQLLEADSGRHVWSDRFDRAHEDYLVIQNDVARAIASAVRVKITPEDEARLAGPSTVDPKAYESYMLGMSFVRRGTQESLNTALKHFDDAISRDPDFALGYAGRAAAYGGLASEYLAPRETMPKVKEAAETAIRLDPNLAEAYTQLGYYYLTYAFKWDKARDAFRRAIDLNPNDSAARIGYADYLTAMKRGDEAMHQLDIVVERDPQHRLLDSDYGYVPFMARRFDRAVEEAEAALAIDPHWWAAHGWLGLAYSQLGEHEKAVQHIREYLRLTPSLGHRAEAGGVLARAGGKYAEEARQIYADLKADKSGEYVCPYELATIPIALGDEDTAFEEMFRACDLRADCLAWLQVDPRLDPIRDDERFNQLLDFVGFDSTGKQTEQEAPAGPPG